MSKPNVTKVEILWSENATLDKMRPDFPNLEIADIALAGIAIRKQPNTGYDKTSFRITFSDGEKYEGRLDLTRNEYSIREHARSFLRFYAGRANPTHLTREHTHHFLRVIAKNTSKVAPTGSTTANGIDRSKTN